MPSKRNEMVCGLRSTRSKYSQFFQNMRKSALLSAGMMLLASTMAYAGESQGPSLTFATQGYDCGIVYYDETSIKTVEIEFVNTGDAPLVLHRIHSCCGTVVTKWPEEPTLPGEKGSIQVRFRIAKQPGNIRRVISIRSNDEDNPRIRYLITGQILKSPD